MNELKIVTEIDDGDDVEGCYVVSSAKTADPYRLWKLICHMPEYKQGQEVSVDGHLEGESFVGKICFDGEPVRDFALPIYHPRIQLGSTYTEYEGKTAKCSRMLLKRADESNVFYVGVISNPAKSELETIFQGPRLAVGVMPNQEWLDWIRRLPSQQNLIMRDSKTHVWPREPGVGPTQATAEKGYEHPGSAIELPDNGGTVHLQYGHPDKVGRNGCFTTDVIQGLIDNLSVYQSVGHPMRTQQTGFAIKALGEALYWINWRKDDRKERGVHETDKP